MKHFYLNNAVFYWCSVSAVGNKFDNNTLGNMRFISGRANYRQKPTKDRQKPTKISRQYKSRQK